MAMLNRKNETSAQTPATKRDYIYLSRLHHQTERMLDNFFAPGCLRRTSRLLAVRFHETGNTTYFYKEVTRVPDGHAPIVSARRHFQPSCFSH